MSTLAITTRDWNRIPKNYKTDNGGYKSILYLTSRGTCLIPVCLDDENGLEYGPYRFKIHGVIHRVFAYSMAEALRIIRASGLYSFKGLSDLERETPYRSGEQTDIIDGRIVYIIGNRYEISDKDGQEVVLSGACEPFATPRQVYEKHFPPTSRWDNYLFAGRSIMEARA